jgi:radical SAM superfamily enzyme with C-terminal helix-hairpin-helix motif
MDMYYKSQINAAYNFIYIGQFQAARTLLRQVRNAVTLQISSQSMVLRDCKKKNEESSSSSCLEDISNGNQKVRNSSSSSIDNNEMYRSAIVLLRMCRAARVFAKRVEKAAGHLGGPLDNTVVPTHNAAATAAIAAALPLSPTKTVDDYARIRLVQDQSTSKDLLGLIVS